MSFNRFLNHTCSIYHIQKKDSQLCYGLSNNNEFTYNYEPNTENAKCHFEIKDVEATLTQGEPINALSRTNKLTLPLDTDIKINDKVIDTTLNNPTCGMEFTVSFIYKVQEHHIVALLYRLNIQEAY